MRWLPITVSMLVAILLNVALLMWLLKYPASRVAVRQETRLWLLARAPDSRDAVSRAKPAAPDSAAPRPVKKAPARRPDAGAESPRPVAPETLRAEANDTWSIPRAGGHAAHDSLGEPGFRRNPFERRGADPFLPRPWFAAKVRDRSLMGRLSDMQRAAICGDLRAALLKPGNEASLDAIQASMMRYGCRL